MIPDTIAHYRISARLGEGRIALGAIPRDEALGFARQIADGLNIKIMPVPDSSQREISVFVNWASALQKSR